ncbi:hypothetical protein ABEF95_011946 [Exophiala dermatitidis]
MACDDRAHDESENSLPCPAQIALALMVVRSRPPHMQIEGYIDSLRKAITDCAPKGAPVTYDFDASTYWRQCYEAAESERARLLEEVLGLMQERDGPEGKSKRPKSRPALGKRKRNVPKVSEKPPSGEDLNTDGETSDDEAGRQALLRSLRSIRRSLRLEVPDRDHIATTIQTIISAIRRSIGPGQKGARDQAHAEEQSIQHLCRVTGHAYSSILEAVKIARLDADKGGERLASTLSDIVRLYETFLGRLHQCTLDEAVRISDATKSSKRGRRSGTKALKRTPLVPSSAYTNEAKLLAKTLTRMVTDLDTSSDIHCELLEGFLCALLDHVGSVLSLFVFGRTGQGCRDSTGVLPPRGIVDVAHLDLEAAMGSAKLEGPYLIFVLRRCVDFLHTGTKQMSEVSISLFSLQQRNPRRAQGLREHIEKTLQNTLLRGVYGDDDDTFYNALRRHEAEDEEEIGAVKLMEGAEQDEDAAEWFIGQLWEHLGWDILSGSRTI